jgi:rod shape-determining protein MreC
MAAWRRLVWVVISLVAATALILGTGFGRRVLAALSPLAAWQRHQAARTSASSAEEAREQALRLNVENIVLRRRLAEYGELTGEGRVAAAQVVAARGAVVARTLREGRRYCELDVGALDGIEVGQAVVRGQALVGRVALVAQGRCAVQALGDAESRIPAALYSQEQCLAEGVLRGFGEGNRAHLEFVEDRPGLVITPGQIVVTTSLDGVPGGLALGTVIEADRGEAADHWRVTVELLRTVDDVESLVVLRPAPGG